MSTDELRKFALLGGWSRVGGYQDKGRAYDPSGTLRAFPDFLAPENLHLCVAVMERFCKERKGGWSISAVKADDNCGVTGDHYNCFLELPDVEDWPDKCGTTLNEAIIKAVTAAEPNP